MPGTSETSQDGELLTPNDVCALLKCSRALLANWRATGGGPPYVRLARKAVRYSRSSLDQWVSARSFASLTQEAADGK